MLKVNSFLAYIMGAASAGLYDRYELSEDGDEQLLHIWNAQCERVEALRECLKIVASEDVAQGRRQKKGAS